MSGTTTVTAAGQTIGLIAGWGRFPVLVAEAAQRRGLRVACVAIRDHADPQLHRVCDHVRWMGVAKFGGHMRFFRQHGVHEVTMAGKIFKSQVLFSGAVLWRHLPDYTCLRSLAPLLFSRHRDTRDDSLLGRITNTYLDRGMHVCPATDIAPELLVKEGMLTRRHVKPAQQRDIEFGWEIAKQMGGMDIGQSITVKDGTVLAVEAVEGTDACIERTGQLCRKGGWTLVKVAKPNQDMRFDVPTIGPQTIETVRLAGGTAIAIEAGMTIVVDQDQMVRAADAAGIAVVAMRRGASQTVAA
ncbi:LpxI family protein [Roseimaritima sediminicola]|uniref:LpxI family protein n=1 Tax=Roseimaritima sediminicola TaxID=2662066 RepID=UPI0012985848|nr:UDP-2,3-diacylglucosamine diphosphatase LpxI [Roseimaritima sediminicola]